jgi:hypothetical protein
MLPKLARPKCTYSGEEISQVAIEISGMAPMESMAELQQYEISQP